jgi:polyisoprenoid-binding protein YceI
MQKAALAAALLRGTAMPSLRPLPPRPLAGALLLALLPLAALLPAALLPTVLLPTAAHGADLAGHWSVRSAKVSYEVNHVLHQAVGRTTAVTGNVRCEEQACTFDLTVPVSSFDSGDAERDHNMLATVHAAQFPLAEVRGSGRLVEGGEAVVEGSISLAGASAPLAPTRFRVTRGWWSLRVEGSFELSLRALAIERPALLGVPIADAVRIYVELELAAQ